MDRAGRVERDPWLEAFVPLYEKGAPLIQRVVERSSDDLPADLRTLVDAYMQLRPVLERAKSLPKPKQREFRRIQKDFEKVLSRCISAGGIGVKMLDDLSHGAPQVAIRMRFATIVGHTEQARIYYESLYKQMASLIQKGNAE